MDITTGPSDKVITVTATGGTQSVIGTASITGTGMSIVSDGVSGHTLAVGNSLSLTVRFDPSADGAVSGTLSIPSDAPATPTTAAITGTGITYSGDPQWALDLRTALATPTYGNTYTVPTGAGYTDGTNCSVNVAAFINAKANGASPSNHTKIVFGAGTYTFSGRGTDDTHGGIVLDTRSNLTIDCSAAAFVMAHTRPATSAYAYMFFIRSSTHIRILSPTVRGGALLTGTDSAYSEGDEAQGGVFVAAGSSYVEVSNGSFDDMLGWPYIVSGYASGKSLSNNIWIHGGNLAVGGVSNFATVGGDYVLFEDNLECQDATWAAMDFEPDDASGHCRHYLIQRNTFRRWGWRGAGHTDWWLGLGKGYTGPPYATMNDITVRDNTIHEIQSHGQGMVIDATGLQPFSDVVITGNVQTPACTASGSPMAFANFGNLTVTGNTCTTVSHVELVGSDTNTSGVHTLTPNTV